MPDGKLNFLEEPIQDTERRTEKPVKAWTVLIVDDEEEVHTVTRLVLQNRVIFHRSLRFISSYSARQTLEILDRENDIAVILLDVVMEQNDTGFQIVENIRKIRKNGTVRIILRTGQPGQAPEEKVILDYDINDYKAKTELTAQKLFSTIVTAIRSYRDLQALEKNRKGLEKIIDASASIFELQSLKKLSSGILTQLTSLLRLESDAIYVSMSGIAARGTRGKYHVLSALGKYSSYDGCDLKDLSDSNANDLIRRAIEEKKSFHLDRYFVSYYLNQNGSEEIFLLEGAETLSDLDINLISVFSSNIAIAYENLYLNLALKESQTETIFTLGEVMENRSRETGNHVRRVSDYCKIIAHALGLNEEETETVRVASALHDIGKIGIADSILQKPDSLNPEQADTMKKHTIMGWEVLKHSTGSILKAAAIIAYQHHERYDGSGYPQGLRGDAIHLYARITSVADVFDALTNDRVYRKAMNVDEALAYLRENSGSYFDPGIVDCFTANQEAILEIGKKFTPGTVSLEPSSDADH
jgi:response regulator RpfG family c-di-GMP phosphodiesterase